MLAENLKKYREAKKISKLELGRRSGVSSRTIEKIESRKNQNPRIDTIRRLANILEVSISDLLGIN